MARHARDMAVLFHFHILLHAVDEWYVNIHDVVVWPDAC